MSITITIQAASDATMTENGRSGGTLLADDDLRKVYGLPNQFINYDGRLVFVADPRWDTIRPPEDAANFARRKYKGGVLQTGEIEGAMMFESEENMDLANSWKGVHRPPTTTAFQLRCNSISHDAADMTTVTPMPGVVNAAGVKQSSGTPGQLNNLVVALGMRSEVIRLEGALVDEGPISASNPRKQVLMNIARLQYFKTGRSGSAGSWGGPTGGPLNPRSYPCLTIYDSELNSIYDDSYQIVQPSGTNLSYRGLIKSFSFRQEGGRPNQWFWTMEFQVLQNEWPQGHQFMGKGVKSGILRINRIRLLNRETGNVISSFPTDASEAVVEVRTSDELQAPIYIDKGPAAGLVNQTVHSVVKDRQPIFITNSDSSPKVDGPWMLTDLDVDAKTFRLENMSSPSVDNSGNHTDIYSYGQPDMDRAWASFTNGGDGYVGTGSNSGTLQLEEALIMDLNEEKALEEKYADYDDFI